MSSSRKEKKIARAMAAARRHKPVRAAWADRMVQKGWGRKLLTTLNITFLSIPFFLIAAFGIIAVFAPRWGGESKELFWWSAAVVAILPFVVFFLAGALLKAMRKRNYCQLSSSEAKTILSYLPNCPELLELARGWAIESGDANLSYYEYDLIYRVASAAEIRMAGDLPEPVMLPEMDDDFYRVFPNAPHFLESEGWDDYGKKDYLCVMACLDQRVGHLDRAHAKAHAAQMENEVGDPREGGSTLRPRL